LSPGFEQILLAEDHSSLVLDLVIMTLPKTRKLGQNDDSACPILKQQDGW
jgi:hypothetical protein